MSEDVGGAPATFKGSDLKRVLKVAHDAGYESVVVTMTPGRIEVKLGKLGKAMNDDGASIETPEDLRKLI